MALAGKARISANAAPTGGKYSVSQGGKVAISLHGVEALSPACVCPMTSSANPPSMFSDLVSGNPDNLIGSWDRETLVFENGSGTWTVAIESALGDHQGAVGDNWYVCVFAGVAYPPGPTDVPDLVFGPFAALP